MPTREEIDEVIKNLDEFAKAFKELEAKYILLLTEVSELRAIVKNMTTWGIQ